MVKFIETESRMVIAGMGVMESYYWIGIELVLQDGRVLESGYITM